MSRARTSVRYICAFERLKFWLKKSATVAKNVARMLRKKRRKKKKKKEEEKRTTCALVTFSSMANGLPTPRMIGRYFRLTLKCPLRLRAYAHCMQVVILSVLIAWQWHWAVPAQTYKCLPSCPLRYQRQGFRQIRNTREHFLRTPPLSPPPFFF